MSKLLHEYRVKPSRSYGHNRRVVLVAILLDGFCQPMKQSHLKLTYDDKIIVCYNPQRLTFNPQTIISGLQSIHGRATKIETIEVRK